MVDEGDFLWFRPILAEMTDSQQSQVIYFNSYAILSVGYNSTIEPTYLSVKNYPEQMTCHGFIKMQ